MIRAVRATAGPPLPTPEASVAAGGLGPESTASGGGGRAAGEGGGPAVAAPSPFARLLRGLAVEVEQGESLTRSAMGATRGATWGQQGALGPGELIALQAGVYRYSEALDLASRLVDRAATSVKSVLQGQ